MMVVNPLHIAILHSTHILWVCLAQNPVKDSNIGLNQYLLHDKTAFKLLEKLESADKYRF